MKIKLILQEKYIVEFDNPAYNHSFTGIYLGTEADVDNGDFCNHVFEDEFGNIYRIGEDDIDGPEYSIEQIYNPSAIKVHDTSEDCKTHIDQAFKAIVIEEEIKALRIANKIYGKIFVLYPNEFIGGECLKLAKDISINLVDQILDNSKGETHELYVQVKAILISK